MKKIFAFCLFFCIVFLLSLSTGCENVDRTSTDSSSTPPDESTSSIQTDSTLWTPNVDEPWNFTPYFILPEDVEFHEEDYDIEFTAEQEVYYGSPEKISCIAVNKTGKPIYACCAVYVEKMHSDVIDTGPHEVYNPIAVWVRLPYMRYPIWATSVRSDLRWAIDVKQDAHREYVFTPGQYRFVVYLADGVHYAYFEVAEAE